MPDHAIATRSYFFSIRGIEIKIPKATVLVGQNTADGRFEYPLTIEGQREVVTHNLDSPILSPYHPLENLIYLFQYTEDDTTQQRTPGIPPMMPFAYPKLAAVLTDHIFAIATAADQDEASKKYHISRIVDEIIQLSQPPRSTDNQ